MHVNVLDRVTSVCNDPMTTLEDRVRAAALLLDAEQPGWFNRVNTERIKMLSYDDCILGQVFGAEAHRQFGWMSGYAYGRTRVDRALYDRYGVGLHSPFEGVFSNPYAVPTWVAEIEARRAPTPRLEMVEVAI